MPKTPVQEMFSGGLVTSRPSHLLAPGELSRADHTVYRRNNVAIQKAPEHGLFSDMDFSNISESSGSSGLISSNFYSEDEPIKLIMRKGRDLFSSSVAGYDGNTFSPVTFPGLVNGTFAARQSVNSCVFSSTSTTVNAPTVGAFNSLAVVGRPVRTPTISGVTSACPASDITQITEYVITAVNYSGANVSSIVLNIAPVVSGTQTLIFAPLFTIPSSEGVFYPESIGFYATRKADVVTNGTDTTSAPSRAIITAVGGASESSEYPGYDSCYLTYIPTTTASHSCAFIMDGGLGRKYEVGTSNNKFDSIYWDNTSFIYGSSTPPYRMSMRDRVSLDSSITLSPVIVCRPAGLLPVQDELTGEEVASYSWNAELNGDNKYFFFIITEAYIPSNNQQDFVKNNKNSENMLEGAYLGKYGGEQAGAITVDTIGLPVPVKITNSSTHGIKLTTPVARNNGTGGYVATHWVVYMSEGKTKISDRPALTSMKRILTVPITNWDSPQYIILSDARTVSPTVRPYNKTSVPGRNQWRQYDTGLDWVGENKNNPMNLPSSYPYNTSSAITDFVTIRSESGNHGYIAPSYANASNDFHFKESYTNSTTLTEIGTSGTSNGHKLYGVELIVVGRTIVSDDRGRNTAGFSAQLLVGSQQGTVANAEFKQGAESPGSSLLSERITLGGPTETWGIDFTTVPLSELQNFRFRISKRYSAKYQHADIIRMGVVLYWTGTTISLDGPVYKCVTYNSESAGISVSDPAAINPPKCSMAAVFQGSLVTDDLDSVGTVRYSLPNYPEYFPSPYKIKLSSRKSAKISAIVPLGNSLIVATESSLKKITSLPRDFDPDFTEKTESVISEISSINGVASSSCAEVFDMPGKGQLLAFISTTGLSYTDGVTTGMLNTDINLSEYVHPSYWGYCILKNYPLQRWLVLYYVPKNSSHGIRSKSFVYSYSEDHIKGAAQISLTGNIPLTGPLPVTGPNDCFVEDVCDVLIDSTPCVASTDGVNVFVEDSTYSMVTVKTTTDEVDATKVDRVTAPVIKTRDIFPAGVTMDSTIGSLYLLHETKGELNTLALGSSVLGSDTISFASAPVGWSPVVGSRLIHGGWDNVVTILSIVSSTSFTVSAPAVRSFTGEGTFDTGNVMIRVNAGMMGEDSIPILTEYRSTSVGVTQALMLEATANRFSVEISKVEDPNTGALTDLGAPASFIGIVYHAVSSGETALHTN